MLREIGDVAAAQADLAGARRQRAGDQIEQRGLAGAVRPDQSVAGAVQQPEVDTLAYAQSAEALVQFDRLQCRRRPAAFVAIAVLVPFGDKSAIGTNLPRSLVHGSWASGRR